MRRLRARIEELRPYSSTCWSAIWTPARCGFVVGGETRAFGGKAPSPEPPVTALVHEPRVFRRVLSQANLGLGEAYLDGDFEITEGSLGDFPHHPAPQRPGPPHPDGSLPHLGWEAVARRFFARRELNAILERPESERREAFLTTPFESDGPHWSLHGLRPAAGFIAAVAVAGTAVVRLGAAAIESALGQRAAVSAANDRRVHPDERQRAR